MEEEAKITWEDVRKAFEKAEIDPQEFCDMLLENTPEKIEERTIKLREKGEILWKKKTKQSRK